MTTENTSADLLPVCEVGEDFLDLVTIAEVGIVARQIGSDPLAEIEGAGPKRWEAMARLGWVLDRRRDPQAPVDRWLNLRIPQLIDALGIPDDDTPADRVARDQAAAEVDAANPTDSAPA